MDPIHTVEYEMTSALASDIESKLLHWEMWRGWKRDLRFYIGAIVFGALIIAFGLQGWIHPAVTSGLLCLLTLFVLSALSRRWSNARMAVTIAVLPKQMTDRHVRLTFGADHVHLEMEHFRGEGAWTELEQVIIFDNFWVLQLTNGGCVVVPEKLVSSDLDAFIRKMALMVMAPIARGN